MILPNESLEEINKIFIPSKPHKMIDKEGEIKKMDSLYELEDYIKENIYDKKYPGVLPDIDINLLPNYSDEEEDQEEYSKNEISEEQKNNEISTKQKKYKIISKSTDIIITDNYSTDDEDEYNAINLLNEDKNEGNEYGWVLSVNKDNMKVYYKLIKILDEQDREIDNVVFSVEATIDYSSDKISNYINDFNFRKEFDTLYNQGKILEEKNEGENLKIFEIYLYMKMPFVFTDRDFVVRKKIWSNHNNKKDCTLIHIKSIENSEYPPKDKPVRGLFISRGAYICPTDNGQSKLYLSTCLDMKMNVSPSMMKQKGSEGQGQWVHKFIENIKKHEN
jgi:hypothetical protein